MSHAPGDQVPWRLDGQATATGQGLIFPVRYRPVPGARGSRRVAIRHGVSAVHSGQRHVLGVIFHNAT